MPVRRRVARLETLQVNPQIFRYGSGLWTFGFDGPAYPDKKTARRAWRTCRREVWAKSRRLDRPNAAETYDGITRDGWEELWGAQHCTDFKGQSGHEVVQAVERDRASVAAFRAKDPRAAKSIADFLAAYLADLDAIEAVTRQLMRPDVDLYCGLVNELSHRSIYRFGDAEEPPAIVMPADDEDEDDPEHQPAA